MTFTSKAKLESKLSDIKARRYFSYGKSRVSGSRQFSYFMHKRSICMPGQKRLFTSNSYTKPTEIIEKRMIQMNNIYKRDRYINSKPSKGIKFMQTSKDLYTFNQFAPYNDESLNFALIAAYKQIFGNLNPMESERPIEPERRLRNGDIPIREFIRELAKSDFYMQNYLYKLNQTKSIELSFMHILGRPLIDQSELVKSIELISNEGFEGLIDHLIDSLEYEEFFGEDIVPFQRFWNSPCGGTTSSFIKTALYRKGFASSDNVIYK